MTVLPYRWSLALVLATLLLANALANRVLPDADVVVGLMLSAALLILARFAQLTRDDLGLARGTWRSGLRWGGSAAGLVVLGYAMALALPGVRESLAQPVDDSTVPVLVTALVVIPLATVIPEELAFRGVLWGLLRREHGARAATLVSSALFGLWHVLPSLGSGPANDVVVDIVGSGALGTTLRVIGTVIFTGAAGVIFCELRRRSDSLLAPILLHWAVNGVGVVAVLLA